MSHLAAALAALALMFSLISCMLYAGQNETIKDLQAQISYHSHSHWSTRER